MLASPLIAQAHGKLCSWLCRRSLNFGVFACRSIHSVWGYGGGQSESTKIRQSPNFGFLVFWKVLKFGFLVFWIFGFLGFWVFGIVLLFLIGLIQKSKNPKTQKSKNPKFGNRHYGRPETTRTRNPKFGFLVFWTSQNFGFLDFWFFGFLVF